MRVPAPSYSTPLDYQDLSLEALDAAVSDRYLKIGLIRIEAKQSALPLNIIANDVCNRYCLELLVHMVR